MKKDTIISKVAGQKSKVSRHYNRLIAVAECYGETARVGALKAAKTRKHKAIEKKYFLT